MSSSLQEHWKNIYQTKRANELSWFQQTPALSLALIQQLNLPQTAKIIDVGGGESTLVDHLLAKGYSDITVLDIAEAGLAHARQRLGKAAQQVRWEVKNVLDFQSEHKFDLWHDRATFHFQTDDLSIQQYISVLRKQVNSFAIVGTFSDFGPKTCSGLKVKQYDEKGLEELFRQAGFSKLECRREDHQTPFQTIQNFVFCSFKKKVSQS